MIDFARLEQAALRIAREKLSDAACGDVIRAPRLGTGGHYDGIFLWDTAFTCMWAKYHLAELPVFTSLDNLYRLQNEDGFIFKEYSPEGQPEFPRYHPASFAPPILSWAEWDLYEFTGDQSRLARVYPHLRDFHRYCRAAFRMADGLYLGNHLGCGMDNLPRWPRDFAGEGEFIQLDPEHVHTPASRQWYCDRIRGSLAEKWNQQGRFIDMSAQMALDARLLARMAELLGHEEDRREFQNEHAELGRTINQRCWSDKHAFYFDLGFGQQVERFHIGAYWCLLAGIVPEENVETFCRHLVDPAKFGRPVPVPSLAADDPDYAPDGGYWRGSSWAPTTYMVLKGLQQVNRMDLAEKLALSYVQAVYDLLLETDTFWENIAPERAAPGNWSAPDFCGWSGLGAVSIPREFLRGEHSASNTPKRIDHV